MKNVITRFNRWLKKDHSQGGFGDFPEKIDIVFHKNMVFCNSYGNLGLFLGDALLFRVFLKDGKIRHNLRTNCVVDSGHSSSTVSFDAKSISGLKYTYFTSSNNKYDEESGEFFLQQRGSFSCDGKSSSVYFDREERTDDSLIIFFVASLSGLIRSEYKYFGQEWKSNPNFNLYDIRFKAKFRIVEDEEIGHDVVGDCVEVDFEKVDKNNYFSISQLPLIKRTED